VSALNLTAEQIQKLHSLSRMLGPQTEYNSAFGTLKTADPASLIDILGSLGVKLSPDLSDFDKVIRAKILESWQELSEPVAVFWEGKPQRILIRHAAHKKISKMELSFSLESKKRFKLMFDPARLKVIRKEVIDGVTYLEKAFEVSRKIPLGYHKAKLLWGERKKEIFVIAAPWRSYRTPKGRGPARSCGLFAPLYSLHSNESLGIGEFTDLEKMIDNAYALGCDFIGTLPMLAIFTDKPMVEPSPYSPASRLFWNELYIDPRNSKEWTKSKEAREIAATKAFKTHLQALQTSKEVDYQAVDQLKRPIMQALADHFFANGGDRKKEFRAFLKLRPDVVDYAEFRAACDKLGTGWHHWPEPMRSGHLSPMEYQEEDKRFHLYSQWLAHQQLLRLAARAKKGGKGIYVDFPLSANAEGYDVWRERSFFVEGATAGCPPDPAHVHGQNWGILPLNPNSIRLNGYDYFRRCMTNLMRYAGILRLDHVMGFYRLFWVPRGKSAKEGVYVRYRMDEFFALLTLESVRNRCELIGEDLGTVPPEIREAMTKHGISRMYVQQRRLSADKKTPFAPIPPDSICSLNTHDMPPFAAFWQDLDIYDKLDLGYFGPDELPAKLKARDKTKAALIGYLVRQKLLKKPKPDKEHELADIFKACLRLTAGGPARVMQVNLEDLWLETLPQNVPGTWKERPNWRRKCRYGIDEVSQVKDLGPLFAELVKLRRGRRRW
jgi:4-alpha-glucanotransferase